MFKILWFLAVLVSVHCAEQCAKQSFARYELRTCTELGFAVCASNGKELDRMATIEYAVMVRGNPDITPSCAFHWKMMRCSSLFHWSKTSKPLVCERTCKNFYRACSNIEMTDEFGEYCKQPDRTPYCEDYSSQITGQCARDVKRNEKVVVMQPMMHNDSSSLINRMILLVVIIKMLLF